MSYYIPTISKKLENYPFLKRTCRKDYYKFKELPATIYFSLSEKASRLYDEIKNKEERKFWKALPWVNKAAIICSSIGAVLCTLNLILRLIGGK